MSPKQAWPAEPIPVHTSANITVPTSGPLSSHAEPIADAAKAALYPEMTDFVEDDDDTPNPFLSIVCTVVRIHVFCDASMHD